MSRAESSNPKHVFEIHPVTSVGTMTVLNSLRPIDGFQPKDAQEAFSRFESLPCKIVSNTVTTTLSSPAAGYNYVEFILEANGAAVRIEDGWYLGANVFTLDGELVVRGRRMVFV